MNKKRQLGLAALLFGGVLLLVALLVINRHAALINPRGEIATKERRLMLTSTLLMLIVVVPVYVMTFAIAWKYRAGNKKAKYTPDWDGHRLIELSWWAIPGVIILILAAVTWRSSHELDPFRSLNSNAKPLTIQVVALQWRWLFIYPQQNIATVNSVRLPIKTPINFEITSDAPMNSFWIPQLGGQIYAMSGMATHLHLVADEAGSYHGSSANISGRGFSDMNFTATATGDDGFQQWVRQVRQAYTQLNRAEYDQLAEPSQDSHPLYYASVQKDLFTQVIAKYMSPYGSVSELAHQHNTLGN